MRKMDHAIAEAKGLLGNKTVMDFLRQNALEKVAAEMQEKGMTCTAKAVDVLSMRHKNVAERVNHYVAAGVVGCLMAKYQ